MAQEQWTTVDSYIANLFIAPDFALEAALDSSKAAGLPAINVSPAQGKLLYMLARMQGARTILELGTLGEPLWPTLHRLLAGAPVPTGSTR